MSNLSGPLFPSELPPKGLSLSTSVLNRPKSAQGCSSADLTFPRTKKLCHFMLHCFQGCWTVIITLSASLSLFTKSRSTGTPLLAGSLTRSVTKLSSKYSRNLLDCFQPAVLYFQQMSDKLKSSTRTRARDCETSPPCLQNLSPTSSSLSSGL